MWRKPILQAADRLGPLKGRFLRASGEGKKQLQVEIAEAEEELRQAIADSGSAGAPSGALDWQVAFAEAFSHTEAGHPAEGGFDIMLANPPYVRADAQFRHLEDDEERQAEIETWKRYRKFLKDSATYETLHEKWDLYIPFLERAYQLLRPGGRMVYIISDAYNGAKYARRSHGFFVAKSTVARIDFCSDIPLFDAGVKNTILHVGKHDPPADHRPVRVRRWGDSRSDFDQNETPLAAMAQSEAGPGIFRPDAEEQAAELPAAPSDCVDLSTICYISKGMVIHANERIAQGSFTAEDLVSLVRDRRHPKPYVEGKDIARWSPQRVRYLEYGTRRAPAQFSRPTFPELHDAKRRILAARMCGERPAVILDDANLYSNHTVIVFVPWHELEGVQNRSIQKTAKYRAEASRGHVPTGLCREDRERTSRRFSPEYLTAIMNSRFAASFIKRDRQGNLDVYPDDWKDLPIPVIPLKEQQPIVRLVDRVLEQFRKYGHPLPRDAAARVAELEQEIDKRVDALYAARQTPAEGHAPMGRADDANTR